MDGVELDRYIWVVGCISSGLLEHLTWLGGLISFLWFRHYDSDLMILMMFEDLSILIHVHFLHQCSTNLAMEKFNSLPSKSESKTSDVRLTKQNICTFSGPDSFWWSGRRWKRCLATCESALESRICDLYQHWTYSFVVLWSMNGEHVPWLPVVESIR